MYSVLEWSVLYKFYTCGVFCLGKVSINLTYLFSYLSIHPPTPSFPTSFCLSYCGTFIHVKPFVCKPAPKDVDVAGFSSSWSMLKCNPREVFSDQCLKLHHIPSHSLSCFLVCFLHSTYHNLKLYDLFDSWFVCSLSLPVDCKLNKSRGFVLFTARV